jgi:myo-inositol-1(or 4)-monophosphatase
VDPLDGTINYVHGLPAFAVSIALEAEGQLECGVVFDPMTDECFSAVSGGGAFLNGRPIRVSECARMHDALVGVSFGHEVHPQGPEVRRFVASLMASQAVRRLGAAALNLAYVAAGRLDAYSACSAKIWDVAAGILLIQEAGGVVTSIEGGAFRLDRPDFASAATPSLHRELLEILARAE